MCPCVSQVCLHGSEQDHGSSMCNVQSAADIFSGLASCHGAVIRDGDGTAGGDELLGTLAFAVRWGPVRRALADARMLPGFLSEVAHEAVHAVLQSQLGQAAVGLGRRVLGAVVQGFETCEFWVGCKVGWWQCS